MKKPREFFIPYGNHYAIIAYETVKEAEGRAKWCNEIIHVIEKSAYDELKAVIKKPYKCALCGVRSDIQWGRACNGNRCCDFQLDLNASHQQRSTGGSNE